jgi:hypothetical protein
VPFHAAGKLHEDSIYAVAGEESVRRFSDDEIRKLLSRRVLIDGKAAAALSRRGFAALTGVEVVADKGRFTDERDEATGESITYPASCCIGTFKPLASVKTLTSLVWRQSRGAETFDRVSPGATLFANELGGLVLCVAYHMDMGEPYSYSEARKEWLLRRLSDLNGGIVPDGIVRGQHNAMSVVRKSSNGTCRRIFIANLGFDPVHAVELTCSNRPNAVSYLGENGQWRELDWTWNAGVLSFKLTLPCYGVAIVGIR